MTRAEFIHRFVLAYKQVDGAITFADALEKKDVPWDELEELEPDDDDDDALEPLLLALDAMISSMREGQRADGEESVDANTYVVVDKQKFRTVVRTLAALRKTIVE